MSEKSRPSSVHPLVWGAVAAAFVGLLSAWFARPPSVAPPASASVPLPVLCGPDEIPDGTVCVPFADTAAAPSEPQRGEPSTAEDRIPRRPDRPARYDAFELPTRGPGKAPEITTRGSLDAPSEGVFAKVTRGAPVRVLPIEGAEGPGEVVAVGELVKDRLGPGAAPMTVVVRYRVPQGERTRIVLFLYANLERVAPGVVAGARVTAGDPVGDPASGPDGEAGEVYLEARLLRDGVATDGLAPERLRTLAVAVPTDVRNVLVPVSR